MANAPDIKEKIDDVSQPDALKRLKKLKTCTWMLQKMLFTNNHMLICVPHEVHDVGKYVEGLHDALAADKLWAVDSEFYTPKGVKAADQPASSMGMCNGAAAEEFNANFMDDLGDDESALLAKKMAHAEEVSQWASCNTLDSQKFASALQTMAKPSAKSMAGVKNHNFFKLVYLLIKEDGAKRRGLGEYQLTLGPVFLKVVPTRLHSALCSWHLASYDAFMLHCIAIFVVNSLVKKLRLARAPIAFPLAVPTPREHGSATAI
jgi:hypothetical protein